LEGDILGELGVRVGITDATDLGSSHGVPRGPCRSRKPAGRLSVQTRSILCGLLGDNCSNCPTAVRLAPRAALEFGAGSVRGPEIRPPAASPRRAILRYRR
jgi:hypothetical protein